MSAKGEALEVAGRFAIAVQKERLPYEYVSVEGPVIEVRPVDPEADLLPMAVRYLGDELGTRYASDWAAVTSGDDHVYTMRPQRWASADLTAAFAELRSDREA